MPLESSIIQSDFKATYNVINKRINHLLDFTEPAPTHFPRKTWALKASNTFIEVFFFFLPIIGVTKKKNYPLPDVTLKKYQTFRKFIL